MPRDEEASSFFFFLSSADDAVVCGCCTANTEQPAIIRSDGDDEDVQTRSLDISFLF